MIPGFAMMLSGHAAAAPIPTVTWNPADKSSDIALSGGNLVATRSTGQGLRTVRATQSRAAGKYYFEFVITTMETGGFILVGLANGSADLSTHIGATANGWGYYAADGNVCTNNASATYGATYAQGNVIGVAWDADNGRIFFSKNGTWQNSGNPATGANPAFTGISGSLFPAASLNDGTEPVDSVTGRFKLPSFSYAPPDGFNAWES